MSRFFAFFNGIITLEFISMLKSAYFVYTKYTPLNHDALLRDYTPKRFYRFHGVLCSVLYNNKNTFVIVV